MYRARQAARDRQTRPITLQEVFPNLKPGGTCTAATQLLITLSCALPLARSREQRRANEAIAEKNPDWGCRFWLSNNRDKPVRDMVMVPITPRLPLFVCDTSCGPRSMPRSNSVSQMKPDRRRYLRAHQAELEAVLPSLSNLGAGNLSRYRKPLDSRLQANGPSRTKPPTKPVNSQLTSVIHRTARPDRGHLAADEQQRKLTSFSASLLFTPMWRTAR